MADFWIQVRDKKQPYDEIILYQVVMVYDDHEVVEPPSPNSNLGFLHVTGCPDHVTKRRLAKLLTGYHDYGDAMPDTDPATGAEILESQKDNFRLGWVDVENLPNPYQTQFYANKTVDIPFGILASRIFHRAHGRLLTAEDF